MLTFHSFRHNFTDALRCAGFQESEFKPLLGHSPMSVTRGYGTEPDLPLFRRLEMMRKIEYAGLELKPLV